MIKEFVDHAVQVFERIMPEDNPTIRAFFANEILTRFGGVRNAIEEQMGDEFFAKYYLTSIAPIREIAKMKVYEKTTQGDLVEMCEETELKLREELKKQGFDPENMVKMDMERIAELAGKFNRLINELAGQKNLD